MYRKGFLQRHFIHHILVYKWELMNVYRTSLGFSVPTYMMMVHFPYTVELNVYV